MTKNQKKVLPLVLSMMLGFAGFLTPVFAGEEEPTEPAEQEVTEPAEQETEEPAEELAEPEENTAEIETEPAEESEAFTAKALLGAEPDAVNAEALPDPTGLKWGSNYIKTMGVWDRVENENIDHYKVIVSKDGTIKEYTVEGTNDGCNFEDFMMENGGGAYTFSIQAIPVEGSGFDASNTVYSDAQTFYTVTASWKTLDESGTETDPDEGYGGFMIEDDQGGQQASYHAVFVSTPNAPMKVTVTPETGYTVDSITFEPVPTDKEESGSVTTFTLDKDYKVSVVFKEDKGVIPVQVEFGEKHAGLAEKIAAEINAEGTYTAETDGTVLTVSNWPKASTVYDLESYIDDFIYAALKDAEMIDEGEGYYGGIGLKELADYEDQETYDKEHREQYSINVDSDTVYYVHWVKPVTENINGSVVIPLCGTMVNNTFNDEPPYSWDQENPPEVTFSGDMEQIVPFDAPGFPASWWMADDDIIVEETELVGGNSYTVRVYIDTVFGYFFGGEDGPDLPAAEIEGADEGSVTVDYMGDQSSGYRLYVEFTVTPEHDWGKPEYTWADDNSTVTAKVTCRADETHVLTETVDTTAKTTKEPTVDAEGEKTYTAEFENDVFETQTKTESIPKLKEYTITYDLDGGKLDGKTGTVTYKYADGTVIKLPKPEKDGYEFDHWEGSSYEAGASYTVTGDHTFKAVWKKKEVVPNTADHSAAVRWAKVLATSLLLGIGCAIARRKRKKN